MDTHPVLSANLHPVDLCPRNSSLGALVISYLLIFSRIQCGSHLLLLLRACSVCSCCTPSAFTACLPLNVLLWGHNRGGAHPNTSSWLSASHRCFTWEQLGRNDPIEHPSHSWSSVLVLVIDTSWAQPEWGLFLWSFRSWWIHASCSRVTGTVRGWRRQDCNIDGGRRWY